MHVLQLARSFPEGCRDRVGVGFESSVGGQGAHGRQDDGTEPEESNSQRTHWTNKEGHYPVEIHTVRYEGVKGNNPQSSRESYFSKIYCHFSFRIYGT